MLDHAVQRNVLDDFERSHLSLGVLGLEFLRIPSSSLGRLKECGASNVPVPRQRVSAGRCNRLLGVKRRSRHQMISRRREEQVLNHHTGNEENDHHAQNKSNTAPRPRGHQDPRRKRAGDCRLDHD
jgi:hypothetical protein